MENLFIMNIMNRLILFFINFFSRKINKIVVKNNKARYYSFPFFFIEFQNNSSYKIHIKNGKDFILELYKDKIFYND